MQTECATLDYGGRCTIYKTAGLDWSRARHKLMQHALMCAMGVCLVRQNLISAIPATNLSGQIQC